MLLTLDFLNNESEKRRKEKRKKRKRSDFEIKTEEEVNLILIKEMEKYSVGTLFDKNLFD